MKLDGDFEFDISFHLHIQDCRRDMLKLTKESCNYSYGLIFNPKRIIGFRAQFERNKSATIWICFLGIAIYGFRHF